MKKKITNKLKLNKCTVTYEQYFASSNCFWKHKIVIKIITILSFQIILVGCSSHLDKSVFEPLTVSEIKKTIDTDTTFKSTYRRIQNIKDSILLTDIEKAKFADLTYYRVYKLIKFSNDTTYFKPIREQLKKEWHEKYGIFHQKVDSISKYWKQYRDENSLEQYVKIELVQIEKEYFNYNYGIRNINLGFRLSPLKGQVDQVRFGYRLEAKINESKEKNVYESIYSSLDKSWCLTTAPFSKPIVRYWEANYSNEKILESKTIETLLRDYNIYIEVDQIRKDGKNISNDDLKIPESVKNHWKYENSEYLHDLYKSDVLKEILNIEYVPNYKYIYDGVNQKYKDKDALAFEFLMSSKDKKDE